MSEYQVAGAVHGGSGQVRSGRDDFRKLAITPDGSLFAASYLDALAREGRIFVANDADENDRVTGATSFAATTPTFLLDVPNGTVAIPLYVKLVQAGTVAGDFITVHVSADNGSRYTSGGTAEDVNSSRTDNPTSPACTLYSTGGSAIVAAAATTRLTILDHYKMPEDVDLASADAAGNWQYKWRPAYPIYVVGAGAFLVNTYAGTTGPTWEWTVAWAEIPESELN